MARLGPEYLASNGRQTLASADSFFDGERVDHPGQCGNQRHDHRLVLPLDFAGRRETPNQLNVRVEYLFTPGGAAHALANMFEGVDQPSLLGVGLERWLEHVRGKGERIAPGDIAQPTEGGETQGVALELAEQGLDPFDHGIGRVVGRVLLALGSGDELREERNSDEQVALLVDGGQDFIPNFTVGEVRALR